MFDGCSFYRKWLLILGCACVAALATHCDMRNADVLFPYGDSEGDSLLTPGDDTCVEVSLGEAFTLYGQDHQLVQVGTTGG